MTYRLWFQGCWKLLNTVQLTMLTLTVSFRDILDFCRNIHQIEISCYHVDHAMSFLFRTLILTLKLPLLHSPKGNSFFLQGRSCEMRLIKWNKLTHLKSHDSNIPRVLIKKSYHKFTYSFIPIRKLITVFSPVSLNIISYPCSEVVFCVFVLIVAHMEVDATFYYTESPIVHFYYFCPMD